MVDAAGPTRVKVRIGALVPASRPRTFRRYFSACSRAASQTTAYWSTATGISVRRSVISTTPSASRRRTTGSTDSANSFPSSGTRRCSNMGTSLSSSPSREPDPGKTPSGESADPPPCTRTCTIYDVFRDEWHHSCEFDPLPRPSLPGPGLSCPRRRRSPRREASRRGDEGIWPLEALSGRRRSGSNGGPRGFQGGPGARRRPALRGRRPGGRAPPGSEGRIAEPLIPLADEANEVLRRGRLAVPHVEARIGDAGGEHLDRFQARQEAKAEAGVEVVAGAGRQLRVLAVRTVEDRAALLGGAGRVPGRMDDDRIELQDLAKSGRVLLDLGGLELHSQGLPDLQALLLIHTQDDPVRGAELLEESDCLRDL